jgi:hypothetical protein
LQHLRLAERYDYSRYQYVFYVDATSAETIEADLKSLALAKKAGSGPDDALTWLARQLENWLILYNNADDTSLDLRRYFPACSHGNILITTRNRRMIHLAQGVEPEYHVSEMSADDAECLLKRAAGFSESTDDHLSTALVKVCRKIYLFKLAISHIVRLFIGAWVLCASYCSSRRIYTYPPVQHTRIPGHVSGQSRNASRGLR